jgi:hypothetical protein
MAEFKDIEIDKLQLDFNNYRTVHQKTEADAVNAIITVSPDWFWALMESIIDDGYFPTDNIIVLETNRIFIVKEGNRRIASLKLIYKLVTDIEMPDNISKKISELSDQWKSENKKIPCAIYQQDELNKVKKIVSLIHAKGEKAGREQWTAVARARYDRDEKDIKVSGLDLLEKYLDKGKNLSSIQKERWGGNYPITVLDELLPKLSSRLGVPSPSTLLEYYPAKYRTITENILYDIGTEKLGFKEVRDKSWEISYGLSETHTNNPSNEKPNANQAGENSDQETSESDSTGNDTVTTNKETGEPNYTQKPGKSKPAHSLDDARSVYKKLKEFKPIGNNREKVVFLLNEMKALKIDKHPHSFCFLLRSMFEISAKAYCNDHKDDGLSVLRSDGKDKTLADILRIVVNHITSNSSDTVKTRFLHGALTELDKKDGMLSVTSMNQLIHNPNFSIQSNDICILFWNIFPLLEEMNK